MSEYEPKPVWALYAWSLPHSSSKTFGQEVLNSVPGPFITEQIHGVCLWCRRRNDKGSALAKLTYLVGEKPSKNGHIFWILCFLSQLGTQEVISLPSTLPAAGIRCHGKKGHGSLVSSSSTLVSLTCICLHLLCTPRAFVCSSSVCRAGFSGFWPQCTPALSLSCRHAFFSAWARTFHWDHCSWKESHTRWDEKGKGFCMLSVWPWGASLCFGCEDPPSAFSLWLTELDGRTLPCKSIKACTFFSIMICRKAMPKFYFSE